MNADEFNLILIAKAVTNVALPALKDLKIKWNDQYPDTKWTNDKASVTLFNQREEEVFQKNLNGSSKGKESKKIAKRKQFLSFFKDDEWQRGNWDISKIGYALIDSKLFRLDEVDDDGIPIGEHIAEIRNIRNRSAHHTKSRCSKKECQHTLMSLSKHIRAFKVFYIDVDKYVEKIECISSEEAPMSQTERNILKLEYEKLKFSSQIHEQKEKTHEERRKRCELYERFLAMQSENVKKIEYLNGKLEHMSRELLSKNHELAMVKLAHKAEIQRLSSENDVKKCTEGIQNKSALNYPNIQLTDLEIASIVLRRPKAKSSSHGNLRSDEQLASTEVRRTQVRNKSKRNAYSMDIEISKMTLADISFESNKTSPRRALSDNLEKTLRLNAMGTITF